MICSPVFSKWLALSSPFFKNAQMCVCHRGEKVFTFSEKWVPVKSSVWPFDLFVAIVTNPGCADSHWWHVMYVQYVGMLWRLLRRHGWRGFDTEATLVFPRKKNAFVLPRPDGRPFTVRENYNKVCFLLKTPFAQRCTFSEAWIRHVL